MLGHGRRIGSEQTDLLTVCSIPHTNESCPVAGEHAVAVVREGGPQRDVGESFKNALLRAVLIPHSGHTVAAAGSDPAVARELDRFHAAAVPAPGFDLRAVFHLPETDGRVLAGRRQHVGIRPPAYVGDRRRVAAQREIFTTRERFPDIEAGAAVAARQENAVGTVFQRINPVGVLLDLAQELAVLGGVNANDLARPAEGDLRLIGADVGGEHGVALIADFKDALAGLHAPDNGAPRFGPAAATGKQQAAVAAEFQNVGNPFRKGKHA